MNLPRVILAFATAVVLGCMPSQAPADECSLAVVFALDVSKSMDSTEHSLQLLGLAAALRDPAVQDVLLSQGAPVALTAFEWSGPGYQANLADWMLVLTGRDIEAFAARLTDHARGGRSQRTGTGPALSFAYARLKLGPACLREVIDISSDGYSNEGQSPHDFYSRLPPDAVTVNALVVGGKRRPVLWEWFRSQVIRGPGAFAMATESFDDYAEAIREKLLREVLAPQLAESK
ncbi:DUF1194 domain-containing protein [Silicimonas algicola]|uniref:Uncharacterized protein DUF1194 n=1 Tax=Silicimonas algicola TaxID=1826607 RepID=A0A316FYI3_9RHOB|nr:DUF1194 domain-containing protein [Silicimonas algicola]AZQ68341.1 DUF1194 domain-containing protein [Silicimonas algicola]PWK53588.1 uncharacterized protein DUF1194 [Silicimonas algicola]